MESSLNFSRSHLPELIGRDLDDLVFFIVVIVISSLILHWIKRHHRNLPPGPRGIPILGYLPFLGSDPPRKLDELSKKYGNIIGLYLGPNYTVILGEYNVMKETLSHPAALDHPEGLFEFVDGGIGFESLNGEEWKEQRHFSIQAMRDIGLGKGTWETLIQEEAIDFVNTAATHRGRPMNFAHPLTLSLSRNIMSLLIGRKLQQGTEDDVQSLISHFSYDVFKYISPSDPVTLMPWLRKYLEMFKIAGYNSIANTAFKFGNFVKNEIKEHKISADFANNKDFIQVYLEKLKASSLGKEKHAFSEHNLEGNIKILFLGGSDTIFSSLKWMFTLMAEHLDIQDKVHAELDDVIGRDGTVCYADRKKLLYIFSVMLETQRFASIVPLSTTRQAREDFTIRGYTIPKGSHIVGNTWAIHNDPNYWEEPERFNPERFLTENKENVKKVESFLPFSVGKRNCPGETVAYMEIFLYFTMVMQKFNVRAPEGKGIKFDVDYGLVCHLKPQELCFIERN